MKSSKPAKSGKPARQTMPGISTIRWSEADLKLIEQLKQKSRIGNTSDVVKHCLGIAAEKYGISF